MKTFSTSMQKKISLMLMALLITTISYGTAFTASSSGNFSSSATWAGGVVPSSMVLLDQITIPSGITVNLNNNLTVNGTLSQLIVNGSLTTNNNSSLTLTLGSLSGTGVIVLNAVNVNVSSAFAFTGSLTANTLNSAVGFSSSADLMVNQSLNLVSGTLSLVSGGSLDVSNNGTIYISGGLLSLGTGGSLGLAGNYNVTYTGISSIAGVELTGSGLQNVTINVNSVSSVTLVSDLTVAGTLTLSSGKLVLAGNDLTINGDVATTGNGTVTSTAVSNVSINASGGTAGTITFSGLTAAVNNLTVNVGAGNQAHIGGSVNVNGSLQLNSGTLYFQNASLTVSGSISGSGFLSGNSASNLTISTGSTSTALNFAAGGQTLNDLSISVGSGNSADLLSNLSVGGNLAIAVGSIFNLNGNKLTLETGSSVSGTGNIVANTSSEMIINSIGGISSLRITGAIGNFTVNSINSDIVLGSPLTVGGMLTLQSGTLVLNSNDLFVNGNVAATGIGVIASTVASDITVAAANTTSGALRFASNSNTVGDFSVNVANSGSAIIGTDLQIDGILNFTAGNLYIAGNALTMGIASTITGAGTTAYIITETGGYLSRNITAGVVGFTSFPVGTSVSYAPANVHLNTGSTSGQVQVGVVNNVLAGGTVGTDLSVSQPIVDATWNVASDISSNLNMNLQVMWMATMEVNNFNANVAYISHYANANWDMSATATATDESGGLFSLQRNGITSLSPFAVFDQNTVTSIAENNNDIKFEIFPNPATDNINIQNPAASAEPVNMDIYNSTGQLMSNHILTDEVSSISVNNLESGHYYIKFYNQKMSSIKPFIKM